MRLLTTAVAALALTFAAVAPADAARSKAKPSCAKKGSKTVLRGSGVRVFTAPARSDGERVTRLYGCLSANGRKQTLSERADNGQQSSGFEDVRLAGRYVAWHSVGVNSGCKADCPAEGTPRSQSVIAWDLVRRRISRRSIITGYTRGGLAVTQRGALAWLSPGTPGPQQLSAADASGTRVLDRGNIAAKSVRAEISIVSWVRDGVERFARLR